ncbi:MAG: lipid II:glycine glycyltransferase FemX [Anaerolineae bacterium]
MGITRLTEELIKTAAEWQELIQQLPDPHPLQTWAWGAFKARWGWEMQPTVFYNGPRLVAAAMILKRKMPYTPWCVLYAPKGPIMDYEDGNLREAVIFHLQAIAVRERAIFIKIDADVPAFIGEEPKAVEPGTSLVRDLLKRGWQPSNDQIQFRNTVLYDITRREEDMLASMKQKTRYNIRLATKKDVTVRTGTIDDLPMIYEMYRVTAQRDRFVIRPQAYYMDGWKALMEAGHARPLIAEYQGQALGVVIIVHFKDRALYMYGASSGEERKRMPNYLLQWEAIKWSKQNGNKIYDFWGAPDRFEESDRMWGVYRFKQGFNGDVAHHIGAWDFPNKPALYWAFTQAVPQLMKLLRRKSS